MNDLLKPGRPGHDIDFPAGQSPDRDSVSEQSRRGAALLQDRSRHSLPVNSSNNME